MVQEKIDLSKSPNDEIGDRRQNVKDTASLLGGGASGRPYHTFSTR